MKKYFLLLLAISFLINIAFMFIEPMILNINGATLELYSKWSFITFLLLMLFIINKDKFKN